MADVPYVRRALTLLFQRLRESANIPTSIRLEMTTSAQMWLSGDIDPEWGNPLAHADQLIDSADPGRQAANLLQLALSRAVIELHGGRWIVEEQSADEPALCMTLPLAGHIAESE